MKIREGFVSNSSSSSFVIIGKKLSEIPEKIGDKKIYLTSGYFNCGEGETVVQINQKIADFINKNNKGNIFSIYESFMEIYDGLEFKSNFTIPQNSTAFCFNRDDGYDYDGTDISLKEFKELLSE
jgi:hypothetical protein